MNNKVTWIRVEQHLEPFMYEQSKNGYWVWLNYKQSKCYNADYKPFLKSESKGLDAFRTAIRLGYEVVKSPEL